MSVTVAQRDAVADHIWNQMVGVAKSSVREVMADAFAEAGIPVSDPAPTHTPVPTSPTGRVDSPVTCATCGESLVVSNRERPDGTLEWDHLSDTPPADDVREAVDHAVRAALSPLGIDYAPWWKVVHAVRDSLLAEPMLEVRPRGTVTNAKMEVEQ